MTPSDNSDMTADTPESVEISDSSVRDINPLVSVVMITYNQESYIARAINGVVAQKTTFPYELIIGEDCSTDRTREIVLDHQRRFSDIIRVIANVRNVGARANSKRVRAAARGKYIAVCEGDDYWTHPEKLQRQVEVMEVDQSQTMCFHSTETYNERTETRFVKRPVLWRRGRIISSRHVIATSGPFIATCSILIRKSSLADLPEWYYEAPTGDWALKLICAARGRIGYVDEVMGTYTVYAKKSWTSMEKDRRWHDNHLAKSSEWLERFDDYTQHKWSAAVQQHITRRRVWYLMSVLDTMSLRERWAFIARHPRVFVRRLGARERLRLLFKLVFTKRPRIRGICAAS